MRKISELLKSFKIKPYKIKPLRGDGSNRSFYRLYFKNYTLILIFPQPGEYGLKEARAYYEFGNFLYYYKIPVPEIKFWDPESGILIVEDLGDKKLCMIKNPLPLYYKTLEILISLQNLAPIFPKDKTLENPIYNFEFLWEKEINYFLNWYLGKYKNIKLDPHLVDEVFLWAKEKSQFSSLVVMHRDFQSKNLIIKKDKIFIIDFQGVRLGPPSYDLASLLHDPYVSYFKDLKDIFKLVDYYLNLTKYPYEEFYEEFKFLSIIRLMQALAAYCKLSALGKYWFKKYIPVAEIKLFNLMKIFYSEIYKIFKK